MLIVEQLACQCGQQRFSFSFKVAEGSICAIMGASGAGKSTLLSLLSGLEHASSGFVSFNGYDFTDLATHQRPLSILFQEDNLFTHLSVFDNIGLGINSKARFSYDEKQQIIQAAEQVQLSEYLNRTPSELSGGQRQRVALARCLVRKKPLILLDEPFSALDFDLRVKMLNLVKNLAKQYSITVLMVTHQIEDARAIADQLLIVDDGKILKKMDKREFAQ